MDKLLFIMAVAMAVCWSPARGPAQEPEGKASIWRAREEPPGDRGFGGDSAEPSTDLWYGTPGVRPGGDLLGPILELVKRPSGLLDFRPRTVSRYLPDRDTAEFLRERR